jgi:demethylmenaquinone methyltransferase/2-methoxy-6-polyprenyl-1,4-benzoquinol methylase
MNTPLVEATHDADDVKKYYAWRASNYDAGSGFEVEHHAEAIRRAEIQPGWHILDAACGTGRATVGLAQAVGPTGRVDAMDLSDDMLDQARRKIENTGLAGIVNLKQGNARLLPYPDASFDLVYNGYMFDLIPLEGFAPILNEMMRVLKPGGRLVLVNMSKPNQKKTVFETVYEKGLAVMPCRPVLMQTYVEKAGFVSVERYYRPTRKSIVALLWGQEVLLARKP